MSELIIGGCLTLGPFLIGYALGRIGVGVDEVDHWSHTRATLRRLARVERRAQKRLGRSLPRMVAARFRHLP